MSTCEKSTHLIITSRIYTHIKDRYTYIHRPLLSLSSLCCSKLCFWLTGSLFRLPKLFVSLRERERNRYIDKERPRDPNQKQSPRFAFSLSVKIRIPLLRQTPAAYVADPLFSSSLCTFYLLQKEDKTWLLQFEKCDPVYKGY